MCVYMCDIYVYIFMCVYVHMCQHIATADATFQYICGSETLLHARCYFRDICAHVYLHKMLFWDIFKHFKINHGD